MTTSLSRWGPDDRSGLEATAGGVTAPDGFAAGAGCAGLKPSGRPDLALVASDEPGTAAAAVTTSNLVRAPACVVTERHVADGAARGVVVNSGNANVCTPDGMDHAEAMAARAGEELDLAAEEMLVMSTGVIGVPLRIDAVLEALPAVAGDCDADGGGRAAEAIMTTDSVRKEVAVRVTDDAGSCVVGGMAKGVGMIEPNMATLLVVLTTDAPLGGTVLERLLGDAVGATFNRISVDGEESTSDTVALLANGRAEQPPGLSAVTRGLRAVCADLARAVVADGEGAERVAAVTVRGAPTEQAAERLARAVATSPLVRAALHGADPNWGRIMMALGGAGVAFEPARVTITCAGITVCRFGVAAAFDGGRVAAAMDSDEVEIDVDLQVGDAAATMLTCDLTPEYVRFNAEYTT